MTYHLGLQRRKVQTLGTDRLNEVGKVSDKIFFFKCLPFFEDRVKKKRAIMMSSRK